LQTLSLYDRDFEKPWAKMEGPKQSYGLRNLGTFLASVQLIGSLSVYLDNVPTSRAIASAEMVNGRNVAVLFNDAENPFDCVMIAVWP
jgi:hypothetical protein